MARRHTSKGLFTFDGLLREITQNFWKGQRASVPPSLMPRHRRLAKPQLDCGKTKSYILLGLSIS